MHRYPLVLLLVCICATAARAQETASIDLRGLAAFRAGDDDVWRSKFIDEEMEWSFVTVPGAWEDNGFPLLDGFAWYRIRFRIPDVMRDDSLLLVMSGVDDADETFLNGVMIGKSGGFPPAMRSELHAVRVYPLPRSVSEEFNLLAVRVFDAGEQGGITGSVFRIVRADSMPRVLDEITDLPRPRPPRFISNGVMVSAWMPDSAVIAWSRPRLYDRITPDLPTGIALSRLGLTIDIDGVLHPFLPSSSGYVEGTGVLKATGGGIETFWYHPVGNHPVGTAARILVVAVRQDANDHRETGLRFVMDLPYWRYEVRTSEQHGMRTTSHILAYNACCTELVDRDMEEFLAGGADAWSLEREMAVWQEELQEWHPLPAALDSGEQQVYRRALVAMRQMQVRERGAGEGQLVAALQPARRAVCEPAAHLLAAEAFAAAGYTGPARAALAFIHRAEHASYRVFDVFGTEFGVGYPYLVSPVPYDGSGTEWRWTRADHAVPRYEGMARYVLAVDALREAVRAKAVDGGQAFSDSAFVAEYWMYLGPLVADVLMYRLDENGLLSQDDGPWGTALSDLPGIHASILTAHALRIAARHARLLGHDLKAYLYSDAADRATGAIVRLIGDRGDAVPTDSARALAARLLHPLLADAVALGVLDADTPAGQFAFETVETGFAIENAPGMFRTVPDGDWFARQARPQITLRLARAYAVAGDRRRADELFATVTREALRHDGVLPELIDPVTGHWHGAMPSLATAADYILTAETIARLRRARH